MKKLVIALVGPQLAGKGKLIEAIMDWCQEGSVKHICTGDILREILELLGRPRDRPNCNKLVMALKHPNVFGEAFLADAIKAKIEAEKVPVVIFDSMRLLVDEQMVNTLSEKTLKVYVTAPPEVRYGRLMQRRRAGEEVISWAQFLENERLETELLIREIGGRSDVMMDNGENDAVNDAARRNFCGKYLAEYPSSLKEFVLPQ